MNILFTVCGRAGSKGCKNKNLKDYLGTSLVYYTLAAIDLYRERYPVKDGRMDVVLNTDSEELIRIVTAQKRVPVSVIHRDGSLGGDSVPKVSVIADCLQRMEKENGVSYDVVVDLDLTSPLRTVQDVRNLIERKMSRNDTDVVYSVTESRRNPYFNMVIEENGFFHRAIVSDFTARQQAPVMYDMNASLYAYSPSALRTKEHRSFFNTNTDAIIMKDTAVLDIDSEDDFELISVIGAYFYQKYPPFGEVQNRAKEIGGGVVSHGKEKSGN